MTPSRTTIQGLISERVLVARSPDGGECRQLLGDAAKHLHTATFASEHEDCAGILLLAYEASRKASLALVRVTGYEPDGEGQHVTTFQAAQALLDGRDDGLIERASFTRDDRHGNMYRAQRVDCDHARESLVMAQDLVAFATTTVERILEAVGPFE